MNRLPFFIVVIFLPFHAYAASLSLEDISPHLDANAKIIWKAPTNNLPRTLWTYEKKPQNFTTAVVSNLLSLSEFKLKPLPKTFTKPITIWDRPNTIDPRPDYFVLYPDLGTITFRRDRHKVEHGDFTPEALIRRTWEYAARLGLEESLLAPRNPSKNSTVNLSRKLDGIAFLEETQGLSLMFGSQGEIRLFTLNWPKLKRVSQERVIGPDEIMQCIRAFKTLVIPAIDEPDYFGRVKALASIQTLTITDITPYYIEGIFGKQPDDVRPERFVRPLAELIATADWGNTNATIRMFSPLISPDFERRIDSPENVTEGFPSLRDR